MLKTAEIEGKNYKIQISDQKYGSGRFTKQYVSVSEVGSSSQIKGTWLTEQGGWDTGKQPGTHKFAYHVARALDLAGPNYIKQAKEMEWEKK